MVITNQKSIKDTHAEKGKESKHNTEHNHQITREEERRKEKQKYR